MSWNKSDYTQLVSVDRQPFERRTYGAMIATRCCDQLSQDVELPVGGKVVDALKCRAKTNVDAKTRYTVTAFSI